ncbi:DUF1826 domain-containing protein [Alteromonas sp. C1M14]|uniref:DUF1826 domain-containing protein n=1 Tax=Alteromonas sp. C1M14 TaxID=2841567 RepID=UPI001C087086|nr:DUF1826 domain-containing protein [Alteromonas sp. C1M14]MBU2979571.1 DUF1826 domain-containing protein [Alteromonas sp. C1M14]
MHSSPLVFSEVFKESVSVACWQRPEHSVVSAYFNNAAPALKIGIRSVFSLSTLKENLHEQLPEGIGKSQAIDDIYLLADMLTCLFDCQEVGLRLAALNQAMCPKFHRDNIPVRLISTYMGPATEWIPNECISPDEPLSKSLKRIKDEHIVQLATRDVALFKGSAWDENHQGAVHRSCALAHDQWRVLLTMDPI